MQKRRDPSTINAGSMADIAFLLLIFFLVTTTLKIDIGILQTLPKKQTETSALKVQDHNLLPIYINMNNEVMVKNQVISLDELQVMAIEFIDNGGGRGTTNNLCDYCDGEKSESLSDHPTKAIIEVTSDRNANYETYIRVLDQINSAYTSLRNKLAWSLYKTSYTSLEKNLLEDPNNFEVRSKVQNIKEKYPLLLSDSQNYN